MRQTERFQTVRDLWLNLVRAACVTQVGGYLGAVTVSRRFTVDVSAFEVGLFGRTAQRVVQEYRLFSELTRDGSSLSIRITREQAPASQTSTDASGDGASVEAPAPIEQPSPSSLARLLPFRRAARTGVRS